MTRLLWTQRQDLGPAARRDHAMAYDPVRQKTVLFGGEVLQRAPGDPQYLADTWEWDGQYWSQVSDIGPSPRILHRFAYDSARNRIVLFGGSGSAPTPAPAQRHSG